MEATLSAKRVRAEMMRQKIGVHALARQAGLEQSTVSYILRRNVRAHIPTVAKLAEALNVDPETLMCEPATKGDD